MKAYRWMAVLVAPLCGAIVLACDDDGTVLPHDAGNATTATDAPAIPVPPLSGAAVQGWTYAQARGCPGCHQSPDAGAGFLSGQLTAVPGTQAFGSNLTPDPDTGMDAWDAGSIVLSLRAGVDNQGQELCPAMPRYPDMTDDEANAIAALLLAIPAAHNDIPMSACPPIKPIEPDAGDAGDAAASDGASEAGPVDAGLGEAGPGDAGPADASMAVDADAASPEAGDDDAGADASLADAADGG